MVLKGLAVDLLDQDTECLLVWHVHQESGPTRKASPRQYPIFVS